MSMVRTMVQKVDIRRIKKERIIEGGIIKSLAKSKAIFLAKEKIEEKEAKRKTRRELMVRPSCPGINGLGKVLDA